MPIPLQKKDGNPLKDNIGNITRKKMPGAQSKDVEKIITKLETNESLLNLSKSVKRVYEKVAPSGPFIGIYE